jgi:hypothetical protein
VAGDVELEVAGVADVGGGGGHRVAGAAC